jgi:hypothetical protein
MKRIYQKRNKNLKVCGNKMLLGFHTADYAKKQGGIIRLKQSASIK